MDRALSVLIFVALLTSDNLVAQPTATYRTINVTFDTREPAGLQIDRGRIVWYDHDEDGTDVSLRFFNGRDILRLDTGLASVRALIDREHVAWITSQGRIRVYNIATGMTKNLADGLFNDSVAAIALANGMLAYTRPGGNGGSELVLTDVSGTSDTTLRGALWNRTPVLHHGQLAWTASESNDNDSASSVFFFDGRSTRKLSGSGNTINERPVIADGQVAWLRSDGDGQHVMLFTGDTTVVLATPPGAATRILGFALANGMAVYATFDTTSNISQLWILDTERETSAGTVLSFEGAIGSLDIDNGLVSWQIFDSPSAQPQLRVYDIASRTIREAGAAIAPVGDDGVFAWTFGDAVALSMPIAYERLTTNGHNGWPQTRFKNIDDGRMIWGNLDSSQNARIMYNDLTTTERLTDSVLYKDFLMLNDGYAIWRQDFNQLWLHDGDGTRRIVDSLQCENMYVDDGYIGFFGFQIGSGSNINQAWIYDIAASSLRQLTNDTSGSNYIVFVDGNHAVWMRDSGGVSRMLYNDGSATRILSDSLATGKYSFVNGLVVWGELRGGITQVISYDVASNSKQQLTTGSIDMVDPATDGKHVVWFSPSDSTMWYYDVATALTSRVTRWLPHPAEWLTMSNGLMAFSASDEVYLFDGQVLSQPTSYIFGQKESARVDNGYLSWKGGGTGLEGDIFRSALLAHVGFDVRGLVGPAPLDVAFDNRSWGAASSYRWDFGDGASSNEKSPLHRYVTPGVYTVSLSVAAPGGTVVERKINLVRVSGVTGLTEDNHRFSSTATTSTPFFAPNPSEGDLTLHFELPRAGRVRLTLCDLTGRTISTPFDNHLDLGSHSLQLQRQAIAPGTYFCRVESHGFVVVSSLVIIN